MPRSTLRFVAAGVLVALALTGIVVTPVRVRGTLELLVVLGSCLTCVVTTRRSVPAVREYWRMVGLAAAAQAAALVLHSLNHFGVRVDDALVVGLRFVGLLLVGALLLLTVLASVGLEDVQWGLDILVWAGGVICLGMAVLLPAPLAVQLMRWALAWALVSVPLLCLALLGLLMLPGYRSAPGWRWAVRGAAAAFVGLGLAASSTRHGASLPPFGTWFSLAGFVLLAVAAVAASRSTITGRAMPGLPGTDVVFLGILVVTIPASLVLGARRDEAFTVAATWGLVALLRLALVLWRERQHAQTNARLAGTDSATGLGNLVYLSRRADALLTADKARDAHVALVLVQVHRFPEISRALGVSLGLEYLRLVADELRDRLGPARSLSSTAAGQFGLLAWAHDEDDARDLGRSVRDLLPGSISLGTLPMPLDCHVGVATAPVGATTSQWLLRQAEQALEFAQGSPQRVAVHHGARAGTTSLLTQLPEAIAAGQLDVALQPMISLRGSGTSGAGGDGVVGFEALVRWRHPSLGLLLPGAFVPAAEETGLIWLITEHVLDRSLALAAEYAAQGLHRVVCVNLSAGDLDRDDLTAHVAAALHRHGLPPQVLELEVTETVALSSGERTRQALHSLASLGVGLAIDDFGTGYSSLQHLQRLPFTRLKVDRSFVGRVCADPTSAALVTYTVDLAHALGLSVVGEGIEDFETLTFLQDVGCDVGQGYVIGRPTAADQLAPVLTRVDRAVLPRLRP